MKQKVREVSVGALLRLKPSRIIHRAYLDFAPRRATLLIYTALPCVLGRVVKYLEKTHAK
jgi:hypothetical protein